MTNMIVVLVLLVLFLTGCNPVSKNAKRDKPKGNSVLAERRVSAAESQTESNTSSEPSYQVGILYIYEDISDSTDNEHRALSKVELMKGFRKTTTYGFNRIVLLRFGYQDLWASPAEEFDLPIAPTCPPVNYSELNPSVRSFEAHRENLRRKHAQSCQLAADVFAEEYEAKLALFEKALMRNTVKDTACPCTSFAALVRRIRADRATNIIVITDLVQDCREGTESFDAPLTIIQVKSATGDESPEALSAKALKIFPHAQIIPGVNGERAISEPLRASRNRQARSQMSP